DPMGAINGTTLGPFSGGYLDDPPPQLSSLGRFMPSLSGVITPEMGQCGPQTFMCFSRGKKSRCLKAAICVWEIIMVPIAAGFDCILFVCQGSCHGAALAGGAFLAAGAATTGGNSAGTLELLKAEGQQTPGEAKKKSKPLNLKIHSSVGSCENIPSQQRSPLLSERSLRSFFVGHAPFLPSTPPVHSEANFSSTLRVLGIYLGVMLGGCFQQPSVFVHRHPVFERQHALASSQLTMPSSHLFSKQLPFFVLETQRQIIAIKHRETTQISVQACIGKFKEIQTKKVKRRSQSSDLHTQGRSRVEALPHTGDLAHTVSATLVPTDPSQRPRQLHQAQLYIRNLYTALCLQQVVVAGERGAGNPADPVVMLSSLGEAEGVGEGITNRLKCHNKCTKEAPPCHLLIIHRGARLVRTESVPCDINNPLRKPPRYSDLHISQTLPKTNKINKDHIPVPYQPDSSSNPSSTTSSTPSSPAPPLPPSATPPSPLHPSPQCTRQQKNLNLPASHYYKYRQQFIFPDVVPVPETPTRAPQVILHPVTSNPILEGNPLLQIEVEPTSENEEGHDEAEESEDDFEEMNLSLLSARSFPRKASQTSIFLQEWDIPFEQLEIGELIGKGRFGQVYHGRWHGEVAIRLIDTERDNEDQLKAFKREVMAYRQTRHENVVLFMGACMSPPRLAIITRH
ncbi:hypothetical protein EI555_010084, partial [Monodon monoceros]